MDPSGPFNRACQAIFLSSSNLNMTNPFKLFLVPIIQLLSKFYPQLVSPWPSPSAEAVNSEVLALVAAADDVVGSLTDWRVLHTVGPTNL